MGDYVSKASDIDSSLAHAWVESRASSSCLLSGDYSSVSRNSHLVPPAACGGKGCTMYHTSQRHPLPPQGALLMQQQYAAQLEAHQYCQYQQQYHLAAMNHAAQTAFTQRVQGQLPQYSIISCQQGPALANLMQRGHLQAPTVPHGTYQISHRQFQGQHERHRGRGWGRNTSSRGVTWCQNVPASRFT